MKLKVPFLGLCLLGLHFLAGPALAAPSPSDYCHTKCTVARCYESCYDAFTRQGSTCAAYLNSFGDLDGDGVVYTSDNCACHANSNQADCDGDGRGDVCDSRNERWVLVQFLGVCRDVDNHAWGWTVEAHEVRRYQNVCNNALCTHHNLISDESCVAFDYSDANECCDAHYTFSFCTGATCGSANCPF